MTTRNRLNANAAMRTLALVASCSAAVLFSSAAAAATDISVWTSLSPHNQKEFDALVSSFNRSQSDVKVNVRAFTSSEELDAVLDQQATKDLPNLVQLSEMSGQNEVGDRAYILPMHTLLGQQKLNNVSWYLANNSFVRNNRGQLQALPYMAEVPVVFYNTEAFTKAGMQGQSPNRVWSELQGQLVELANNGSRHCPLTSDQSVSVNLENLAAVNNQLYGLTPGAKGKNTEGFKFDLMYIRHVSMMVSWVKSELMVRPEFLPQSSSRFANGECAVMFSDSGHLGAYAAEPKLKFAIQSLPYYPEVTRTPGKPFVTGSALWATKGHSKESDQASARFISWLAQPDQAARWYQGTGYLPLTKEALAATPADYYAHLGEWQNIVGAYGSGSSATAKGSFRNYRQVRAVFNQSLESALEGKQPAVTALNTAAAEANRILQQKAR